jgi:hypothetical protein
LEDRKINLQKSKFTTGQLTLSPALRKIRPPWCHSGYFDYVALFDFLIFKLLFY